MHEPGRGSIGRRAVRTRSMSGPMDRLGAAAVRFSRDGRGTTAIEYALIAGLIFLAVVGSLRFYTSRVSVVYDTISAAVTQSN